PVIYYGSEMGFERGRAEHQGNRNYYGIERIAQARSHPIRQALSAIARLRAQSPALQKGIQINLELSGDRAAYYRAYNDGEQAQIALVLLNKADQPANFVIDRWLEPGQWRSGLDHSAAEVRENGSLSAQVSAHGVQVFLLDQAVQGAELRALLDQAMADLPHRSDG
ncbi:MAG: cyclomaltodextrin glucanotransferase, partial [Xanthomonadales bacterium]|nr:cyclomaltodextrin glucanotransferase [Xanthomonadales bacterium]